MGVLNAHPLKQNRKGVCSFSIDKIDGSERATHRALITQDNDMASKTKKSSDKPKYFIVYEILLKEVDDLTQAVVLSKVLNFVTSTHTPSPLFQQSYMAKILNLSTDTVGRALEGLSKKGFLTYKVTGFGTSRNTQYTLTEKTYSLIEGREATSNHPHEPSEDELKELASASTPEILKQMAAEKGIEMTPNNIEKILKMKNVNNKTQRHDIE